MTQEIAEIIRIKQAAEADLLGRPGVTGVGVGYKYVAGERTDQVVIRVHVAHKRDDVPEAERIPETIDGVPTDVLESRFEEIADTGRYRPVCGGIASAGTTAAPIPARSARSSSTTPPMPGWP